MSGETQAIGAARESSFRRFSDKLMGTAFALILLLVGAVWAITWRATDSKVGDVGSRVGAAEEIQRKHSERIIKLEVLQDQTQRDLRSIDDKQSKMEGKIESVQRSVNDVLIELRKPK